MSQKAKVMRWVRTFLSGLIITVVGVAVVLTIYTVVAGIRDPERYGQWPVGVIFIVTFTTPVVVVSWLLRSGVGSIVAWLERRDGERG